ncbi:unnamed protein product, partial [Chrysoparadoxa australica]
LIKSRYILLIFVIVKLLFSIILVSLLSGCIEFRFDAKGMNDFLGNHQGELFSDTLLINDQLMHYVYTQQQKETLLVFVHGSPGSWNAFSRYLTSDSLQDQYDMVSIDRPGFGYSDYGYAESSLKRQANLISQVIQQFDQKRKILIGHSLGGPIIARIAMDYPEQVQGMIFIAPSIDPDMEKYEWYRTLIKTWVGDLVVPTDLWVSNEEIVPLKEELNQMLPL